jgi:hypothetical protein
VVAQSDVLIAVIGRHWAQLLRDKSTSGERDYVREEIAEALRREIAVVPTRRWSRKTNACAAATQ